MKPVRPPLDELGARVVLMVDGVGGDRRRRRPTPVWKILAEGLEAEQVAWAVQLAVRLAVDRRRFLDRWQHLLAEDRAAVLLAHAVAAEGPLRIPAATGELSGRRRTMARRLVRDEIGRRQILVPSTVADLFETDIELVVVGGEAVDPARAVTVLGVRRLGELSR